MNTLEEEVRERLWRVRERIRQAARAAGRDPDSVRLVVVTKGQGVEAARAAIRAGAGILGENYAEEAVQKIESLRGETAVEWHLIGHLQSRKAPLVVGRFALFHALDSLRLAERLDRLCVEAGVRQPVLLEFNVGLEPSKYGWPAADEAGLERWLPEIERIARLPGLEIRGLMAMPPLGSAPADSRPYFERLRALQAALARRLPQADWSELSMGTSGDFEEAIAAGATLVRIGTAILGPRPLKPTLTEPR